MLQATLTYHVTLFTAIEAGAGAAASTQRTLATLRVSSRTDSRSRKGNRVLILSLILSIFRRLDCLTSSVEEYSPSGRSRRNCSSRRHHHLRPHAAGIHGSVVSNDIDNWSAHKVTLLATLEAAAAATTAATTVATLTSTSPPVIGVTSTSTPAVVALRAGTPASVLLAEASRRAAAALAVAEAAATTATATATATATKHDGRGARVLLRVRAETFLEFLKVGVDGLGAAC